MGNQSRRTCLPIYTIIPLLLVVLLSLPAGKMALVEAARVPAATLVGKSTSDESAASSWRIVAAVRKFGYTVVGSRSRTSGHGHDVYGRRRCCY
ncbi:unnamed protein product [Linum trigynum]|uniref:Uncharacterized protein n=1 Tax=Linum trigynum TaxID=586398 RepID=A0AAV2FNH5_9ROSI